mmetsp:Transcript_146968/g.469651  ORF Transcript_146968/g.469651 Transcript_146968/m.469651 type:complete len:200 (+) Transcript_146968:1067-1666(+)
MVGRRLGTAPGPTAAAAGVLMLEPRSRGRPRMAVLGVASTEEEVEGAEAAAAWRPRASSFSSEEPLRCQAMWALACHNLQLQVLALVHNIWGRFPRLIMLLAAVPWRRITAMARLASCHHRSRIQPGRACALHRLSTRTVARPSRHLPIAPPRSPRRWRWRPRRPATRRLAPTGGASARDGWPVGATATCACRGRNKPR